MPISRDDSERKNHNLGHTEDDASQLDEKEQLSPLS